MSDVPSGPQVATILGICVPALVASGLAIGGYHNRPVAVACFLVAGIALIAGALYVPLRRAYWRRIGSIPIRASHKLIGNRALLRLDLGTEPAITDVSCEVHIPHYMRVGGIPKATAEWKGSPSDRIAVLSFPGQFGLAPIFSQARVLGRYQVHWIITQNGSPRIVTDRFHIARYTFVAAFRDAWEHRKDPAAMPFWRWLASSLSFQLLYFTRLGKFGVVRRAWDRIFPAPQDSRIGPITLAIGENVGISVDTASTTEVQGRDGQLDPS